MKFEDYDAFYKIVIRGYIDELIAFDKKYNVLTLNQNISNRIYDHYERKRLEIRNKYMAIPDKPIDRHKTASTMMYAILQANVFKISLASSPNLPIQLRLANEYLAVYVALNIIELYKRKDESIENNIPDSDYQLIIPETKYEKQGEHTPYGSFITSLCLTLANIKKMKYFDFFAYSTILFLLENNTDTILSKNKEIEELKALTKLSSLPSRSSPPSPAES